MAEAMKNHLLESRAAEAQLKARSQVATPSDTLLVTPAAPGFMVGGSADDSGVLEMSGREIDKVADYLASKSEGRRPDWCKAGTQPTEEKAAE
jgi:hypothetical protein